MAAVAKNPKFAKKVGVPQSVGEEFLEADKGKKFREGGTMKKESKEMMKKEVSFMKKKGAPKSMIKHEEEEMMGMKKGGMAYAKGGMARSSGKGMHSVQKKAKEGAEMVKMAKGGYVRSADGCAKRGLTKGKMMAKGGKC